LFLSFIPSAVFICVSFDEREWDFLNFYSKPKKKRKNKLLYPNALISLKARIREQNHAKNIKGFNLTPAQLLKTIEKAKKT